MRKHKIRCERCNKILAYFYENDIEEIECPRCGYITIPSVFRSKKKKWKKRYDKYSDRC